MIGKLGGALLVLLCLTAFASTGWALPTVKEKSLGTFDAWRAFTYDEGGQRVCYMVTTKIVKSTGPKKRGTPYLMITHRPTEASTDVISYGAGLALNAKRGIKMMVSKSTFDLFSVRDTSWARDAQTDHRLAAALTTAPSAFVSGWPEKKGSKSFSDHFDLTGAHASYLAIGKACGLIGDTKKKPVTKKANTTPSSSHKN